MTGKADSTHERPMTLRQQRDALLSTNRALVERLAGLRAECGDLRSRVCVFIMEMDELMKGPGTYERGQRIARLMNDLQDAALDGSRNGSSANEDGE